MFIPMRVLPFLPHCITTPMALMNGHVNEWHSIKARTLRENHNLSYNDKQTCEQRNRKVKKSYKKVKTETYDVK